MWSFLRWALIAANGFSIFVVTALLWEGLTRPRGPNGDETFTALVLFVLCLNLYFLIFRAVKGNDWLSLWMKRKKLEEEKRILELEQRGP